METTQRESRKHQVNPERKYIRLQEIGLSFWLSIPVAMMLAAMFALNTIIGQIAVLLFIVGCIFFSFGSVGREELKEQREAQNNGDNDTDKS